MFSCMFIQVHFLQHLNRLEWELLSELYYCISHSWRERLTVSFSHPSSSSEHNREVALRHLLESHHQAFFESALPVSWWSGGSELGITSPGCPEKTHIWHNQCLRGNPPHFQEVKKQHSVAVSKSRLFLFYWWYLSSNKRYLNTLKPPL